MKASDLIAALASIAAAQADEQHAAVIREAASLLTQHETVATSPQWLSEDLRLSADTINLLMSGIGAGCAPGQRPSGHMWTVRTDALATAFAIAAEVTLSRIARALFAKFDVADAEGLARKMLAQPAAPEGTLYARGGQLSDRPYSPEELAARPAMMVDGQPVATTVTDEEAGWVRQTLSAMTILQPAATGPFYAQACAPDQWAIVWKGKPVVAQDGNIAPFASGRECELVIAQLPAHLAGNAAA